MDEKTAIFAALSRDPMLAAEDGTIVYCNEALTRLLPEATPGEPVSAVLPDYLLEQAGSAFTAAVEISGREFTAHGLRLDGDCLAVTLIPEETENRSGFLSDGLIAGMSAQLFNIGLAADRVNSELPEGPGFDGARAYLAALCHSYRALERQIANLDTVLKMQEGTDFFFPAPNDLVSLCDDLAATVDLLSAGKHASVEFETELPKLVACVDSTHVERLLLNLLSNSLLHTPPEGHIRIGLTAVGSNAVISVDDNGSGIPADVMQNIFTRYEERIDPEKPAAPLSGGLGLTVARGIAERHGGALVLESREGRGTSVRVMLPLEQNTDLLESRTPLPGRDGMALVLSELSDVLESKHYHPKFID